VLVKIGLRSVGEWIPLLRFGVDDRGQRMMIQHRLKDFLNQFPIGTGSEVIARLQAAGLNATAVQNPLTTLPESVASAQRVLARQDAPTVLVGHSFAGMIVTEAGVHPNVSTLVHVAARAPDAGEDYTALAKRFPTPPATAGIVYTLLGGAVSWPLAARAAAVDAGDRLCGRYVIGWLC
jgi:hypothetical protein